MALNRRDFLKFAGIFPLSPLAFSIESKAQPASTKPVKPRPLKKGDTIGLVAPGSPIYDSTEFDRMLHDLEEMGFRLKLGKHIQDQYGYLAGKDEDRAADLMNMFDDDDVDGIICIRGGWGCNRILPLIDFGVISANPKVFMGFSDITSLHMAIHKMCGLVTFHGPVGKSIWTPFTKKSFQDVIWNGEQAVYPVPEFSLGTFTITAGEATGRMMGGNLSVLVSMIGSTYLPDFTNCILFLEDVDEDVYRIDRMLTQLKMAGILNQISGFIFGKCTDCDAGSNSLSLNQVFEDHIKPLGIPAFYGAMISHEDDNVTIPIGVEAVMDAGKKQFRLSEPGVQA